MRVLTLQVGLKLAPVPTLPGDGLESEVAVACPGLGLQEGSRIPSKHKCFNLYFSGDSLPGRWAPGQVPREVEDVKAPNRRAAAACHLPWHRRLALLGCFSAQRSFLGRFQAATSRGRDAHLWRLNFL